MTFYFLEKMSYQYQLWSPELEKVLIISLIVSSIAFALFSFIGARVVSADRITLKSAILTSLNFLASFLVLSVLFELAQLQFVFASAYEMFNLIVAVILFSGLASYFFKTSLIKGVVITLITAALSRLLLYAILSLLFR